MKTLNPAFRNHLHSISLGILFICTFTAAHVQAQTFPNFTGFHQSSDVAPLQTLSQPIETTNGYFGEVLLLPAENSYGIYFYESTDGGQTWGVNNAGTPLNQSAGGSEQLNSFCTGQYPNGCGIGVGDINGTVYMAFSDVNEHLSVYEVIPDGTTGSYFANQVFEDTSVKITSAPCLIRTPNNTLLIRYGTSNSSSLKNVAYVTQGVPQGGNGPLTFTTHATTGLAPTQCAMVYFNNSIYAFDGQDNSDGGVFQSQLDNNGNEISNTAKQIPGASTKSGLSAVVFNGTIDIAYRQNSSSNYFMIAASGDGSNWGVKQYPNKLQGTPFLGLFGGTIGGSSGALTAVTIANDSSYSLYSDYTPN